MEPHIQTSAATATQQTPQLPRYTGHAGTSSRRPRPGEPSLLRHLQGSPFPVLPFLQLPAQTLVRVRGLAGVVNDHTDSHPVPREAAEAPGPFRLAEKVDLSSFQVSYTW